MFHRVAIANRGEVACRIIQACDELGLCSILLHSDADRKTKAFRMACETVSLEGNTPQETYLNIPKIIDACVKSGAEALHPGFGFLSENAEFVQALSDSGITFIGPDAKSMELLGNKVSCKILAKKVGVPLIPGYDGESQELQTLVQEVLKIGLPVVVKASAGGGGRGMKVITKAEEALAALESAKREALAAFGNDHVFLEKYLESAKHVEVQVFVNVDGKVYHLYTRECSVQRRHQKMIEEAPAAFLSPDLMKQIHEAACRLVGAINYRGAATVEFLVSENSFYLLEVNTRLQVEHPVTEEVLGVDLVKCQILTAQGKPIDLENLVKRGPVGHAIECRIYAEDPYQGGIPSTGPLLHLELPQGPGRRFDFGLETGDPVTSFYDPMIGKVIVWDMDREKAIKKMDWVLKNVVIFGVRTNIPLLRKCLAHPLFAQNQHSTQFFTEFFAEPLKLPPCPEFPELVEWVSPPSLDESSTARLKGVFQKGINLGFLKEHELAPQKASLRAKALKQWGQIWLYLDGQIWLFEEDPVRRGPSQGGGVSMGGHVVAPMPGRVTKVMVQEGEKVSQGQTVMILEAMKMEYVLKASKEGRVLRIHSKVGDTVELGKVLVELEAQTQDG